MTQDQLADALHVTRQAVSNWETGKNDPDLDMLMALAEFFEVDVNELLDSGKPEASSREKIAFSLFYASSILALLYFCRVFEYYAALVRNTTYVSTYYFLNLVLVTPLAYLIMGFLGALLLDQWHAVGVGEKKVRFGLWVVVVVPLALCWGPAPMLFSREFANFFTECLHFGIYSWYRILKPPTICLVSGCAGGLLYAGWSKRKAVREKLTRLKSGVHISGILTIAAAAAMMCWLLSYWKLSRNGGNTPAPVTVMLIRGHFWCFATPFAAFMVGLALAAWLAAWHDLAVKTRWKRRLLLLLGAAIPAVMLGVLVYTGIPTYQWTKKFTPGGYALKWIKFCAGYWKPIVLANALSGGALFFGAKRGKSKTETETGGE